MNKEVIHGVKIHESMSENEREALRNMSPDEGEEFSARPAKVRITMMIDSDVLKAAKDIAHKISPEGKGKYQTLINDYLRRVLIDEKTSISHVDLHQEIEKIIEEKLERSIHKVLIQKNLVSDFTEEKIG